MRIVYITLIIVLTAAQAQAQQSAQIYMHPTAPEYATSDLSQIQIIDNSLQNELFQFAAHRGRVQEVQFVSMDGNMVQEDSFVFKRFLDRSVNRLMKSDYFKKSSVGRSAEAVKRNTETDMAFGQPGQIQHKFEFKVAAFQRQAFIQYSGFTKIQMRYDMGDGGSLAALYRKDISKNGFMGLENRFTGETKGQYITLNFAW